MMMNDKMRIILEKLALNFDSAKCYEVLVAIVDLFNENKLSNIEREYISFILLKTDILTTMVNLPKQP